MFYPSYIPDQKTKNAQNEDLHYYIQITLKAYVDAVIPRTPGLAYIYGKIQYPGALDFDTDEYLLLSLNQSFFPLAKLISELLNSAAQKLVLSEGNRIILNYSLFVKEYTFASLSPEYRLHTITLLEQLKIDLSFLPKPFKDNPEFLLSVISSLNRITMMGYYSEWFGYGSTRLETPNDRKLEYYPLSWSQVGYPGPSLGYHALRK